MALVTLTFSAPLNTSCQVGDLAYYVTRTSSASTGGFTTNDSDGVKLIGQIREITNPTSSTPAVICDSALGYNEINGASKFILFSKDNKANLSSILGYYASVKLVNDSTVASELFSVGVDTFESSK
jgi:hypothetical protein